MQKIVKTSFIYLFTIVVTFLFGIVVSDTINFYNSNYEIVFSVNEEFDYEKLDDQDYLISIKNTHEKYKEIDVEKMIENEDVSIEYSNNEYKITTGYEYYETFFISSSKEKGTRVKQFFKDAINNLVSEDAVVTYKYSDVYIVTDKINIYLVGGITSVLGVGLLTTYLVLNKDKKEFVYDNKTVYKTPFHKEYFKSSIKFLDNTKKIVIIAMLFSLMMVCKLFSLPTGFSHLGISLTYLFFSLIALIYGPVAGITMGFFSDVLGYFLFNKVGTVFYFGYTLQSMLAGLTYGLFFYKTRITFTRCFFARVIVNLLLNVVWGSICFGNIMGYDFETTKMYALVIELPKNLIYLLPQSMVLYIFLKFVSPILYRNKLINKTIYENISII